MELLEHLTLGEGIVHVLLLEGTGRDLGLDAGNALLGVLLGPCRAPGGIADVDDIPMVGLVARALHAAVKRDDIAAEDHQKVLGNRSGREQGLLEPVPLLLKDVGVTAVGIGVIVVDENRIRADSILAGATRGLQGSESTEGSTVREGEFIGLPVSILAEVAIVGLEEGIGFKGLPVGSQKTLGVIVGVGDEQQVTLPAGADQVHSTEEDHGRLRQLTGPGEDLVPFGVGGQAADRLFMESGERIAGILREKEADPRHRVSLQLAQLQLPLRIGQGVDRLVALEGAVVFAPLLIGLRVVYFAHCIRSLMYESK